MQNALQTFTSENFGSIRVLGDIENPLFCASDVCKALGHSNSAVILNRLFEDGVTKCYPIIDAMGREQEARFLTEAQLYKLIIRSHAKNAEPFQDWVCGEVLPSIRKTGKYSTEPQFKIPQTYAEALLEAGRLALENERLLEKAKEDAPKVRCFDALMDCKNSIDFMEFSKIIGIGRTTLFSKCRELGILMHDNKPMQRFVDCGYFRVVESTYTQGDYTRSYTKTMILPKGQAYLAKKLKAQE